MEFLRTLPIGSSRSFCRNLPLRPVRKNLTSRKQKHPSCKKGDATVKNSFKVTFITPHVGRKDPSNLKEYVRTWQMASLPVATLAGLTPEDVEIAFYDERVEFIDFE